MRNDMARILVERPRRQRYGTPRKSYQKSYDWRTLLQEGREEESPVRDVQRRRKYGYDAKVFDDFIAPLYRFLQKSVGRPWNDVFSEICERIKLDSTTQRHIRQHVDGYVSQSYIMVNGKAHSLYGYPLRYFYVHEGMLCEAEYRRWRPDYSDWTPSLSPDFPYVCLEGFWYSVSVRKFDKVFDVFAKNVQGDYVYSNKKRLNVEETQALLDRIEGLRADKARKRK